MIHRRRLLMSGMKLDVAALEFSYTGTWTDTQIVMSGMTYRVLQLKSNGVLTLDPLYLLTCGVCGKERKAKMGMGVHSLEEDLRMVAT